MKAFSREMKIFSIILILVSILYSETVFATLTLSQSLSNYESETSGMRKISNGLKNTVLESMYPPATSTSDESGEDEVRIERIDRETLKKKMDAHEDFLLLDARSQESYEIEHIVGAVSLPVDDAEEKAMTIIPDKDTEIIIYCSGLGCPISPVLAEKLIEMGYTKVWVYQGGLRDWKEAGYQTEGNRTSTLITSHDTEKTSLLTSKTSPTPTTSQESLKTLTESTDDWISSGKLPLITAIIIIALIFGIAVLLRRKKGEKTVE